MQIVPANTNGKKKTLKLSNFRFLAKGKHFLSAAVKLHNMNNTAVEGHFCRSFAVSSSCGKPLQQKACEMSSVAPKLTK